MSRETLYEIACEMLQTTNQYSKDVSEIKYTNRQGTSVSLLDCVKKETSAFSYKYRGKSEQNIRMAFDSITWAMSEYLEGYPAPFAFKQNTRDRFVLWLEKIEELFSVTNVKSPYGLGSSTSETHTGIAILKLLHARQGTTVREMADELHVSTRAIQKDLVKLSFSASSRDANTDIRIRLGGQPLQAKIDTIKDPETYKEIVPKRYLTHNSVSPLVLQENIMQLATLLKALCRQFCDHEDDSAKIIAVDIWNQMSEYAQNKIKRYYAYNNEDLSFFIKLLEDNFPDDHACPFHTERELLDRLETSLPIDQALPALMKVEGRTGIISLCNGITVFSKKLLPVMLEDGTPAYEAVDAEGGRHVFTEEQVEEIEIL